MSLTENDKALQAYFQWRKAHVSWGVSEDQVFIAGWEANQKAMMSPAEARFLANDSIIREADRFKQTCEKLSQDIASLRQTVEALGKSVTKLEPIFLPEPELINNNFLERAVAILCNCEMCQHYRAKNS